MLIDLTVADLPGVDSSTSDVSNGSTVVAYDDEVIGPDQIVSAIRGAGYDASIAL
jgi:copper chaperone CopZ